MRVKIINKILSVKQVFDRLRSRLMDLLALVSGSYYDDRPHGSASEIRSTPCLKTRTISSETAQGQPERLRKRSFLPARKRIAAEERGSLRRSKNLACSRIAVPSLKLLLEI